MFEKWPNFCDFRGVVSHLSASALDFFQILAATGIGTESRSREPDGAANSVLAHLAKSVCQQRMPIAVTPVNRESYHLAQRGDQFAILIVNGAAAFEMIVVLRYCEHALTGDVAASQHILQEGDNLFALFRAAKGDNQKSLETRHTSL